MKLKVINKYGKITKVGKANKDLVNKNIEYLGQEIAIDFNYAPRKLRNFIKENNTNPTLYFLNRLHPNVDNWTFNDYIYTVIMNIRHQTENGIKNAFGMFILANNKLYYVEECFVFYRGH